MMIYLASKQLKTVVLSKIIIAIFCALVLLLSAIASAAQPIANYKFDQAAYSGIAGEVIDSIGNFDAVAQGAQPVAGKICQAVDLSATGIADYVELPNTLLNGVTDFSISLWAKTTKTSNQSLLSGATGGSYNEVIMWLQNSSQFRAYLHNSPSSLTNIPNIANNSWHHIVFTHGSNQSCIYVDGVLRGCVIQTTTALQIDPGGLFLGQEQDSVGGGFDASQAFNGLLDEVLVFDQAIDQTQISDIYSKQNAGQDLNGQLVDCTISSPLAKFAMDEIQWIGTAGEVIDETGIYNAQAKNGATTASSDPADASNPGTCGYGQFDGVNDYLELPSNFPNLTGSFTVTAWIKPANLDPGSRIFADDEGVSPRKGYAFSLGDPGSGKLRFFSRGVNPISVDTKAPIAVNTWSFVTAVHDADAKTRKIYINGVLQELNNNLFESVYTGTWGEDNGPVSIGGETNNGETDNRFTGAIDEVQVFESALSATQINEIYTQTHPCTEAADPIANLKFDQTEYNGVAGEVIDSIGSFNAVAFNAQPVPGKVCQAVDLSATGIADYVELPNTLLNGVTDFSISLWAKTTKTGSQSLISGANSSSFNELIMFLENNMQFRSYLYDSREDPISISDIGDDTWHHLVFTHGSDQSCIYIDGVLHGCVAQNTSTLQIDPSGLFLGQEQDSLGGGFAANQAFDGLIDELLVFDQAIGQSQVSDIYNKQNAGLDLDGQPVACAVEPIAKFSMDKMQWNGTAGEVIDETGVYNGQAKNGATTASSDPAKANNPGTCGYGEFDGTDDYVELPSNFPNLTGSFTVTAWIKPANLDQGSRIFADDEGVSPRKGYAFSLGDPGAGKLRFFSRGVNPVSVDTKAPIAVNTWSFVTAVHDADAKTRKIYINGVLQELNNNLFESVYTGTWGEDNGPVSIGGETDSGETGNRFTGAIDEVQVFQVALNSTQINEIYNQTHPCGLVAHYQMNEPSWASSTGVVIDSISGFNGNAFNGADTVGDVCLYGNFDGVDDYVQIPHNDALNGSEALTYTAFVRANSWSGTNQIMAKSVHGGGSGRAQMGIFSENGVLKGRAETAAGRKEITSSLPLPSGDWVHLGLVFDGTSLRLYQDGTEVSSVTFSATTLKPTTDPLNISKRVGTSQYYFHGLIDDIRVYTTALSEQDINDIIDSTSLCSLSLVDHYQIVHDGNGLTCEAETVTIKACTNAYDGTCSESSEPVTLEVKAVGSVTVTDTISFTGSGTASLAFTNPETTILSLDNISVTPTNNTVCNNNSANSCQLVFTDAGFRFLNGSTGTNQVIDDQVAGTSFPIRLQAVQNDNGVCTGIFNSTVNIDLAQLNQNPGGTTGQNFAINGTDIGKALSSTTSIALNFSADSIATLPSAVYKDAGQISLYASYSDAGISLTGNSSSFWVAPHQLVISAQSSGVAINGASASATTVHKAGESFDLVFTAYNSLGTTSANTTLNYQPSQLQLKLTRLKPSIAGSVDGNLAYATNQSISSQLTASFTDSNISTFNNGVYSFAEASFSEVGVINLDIQDLNYGSPGLVVAADDLTIGRFTPDHFVQTVKTAGSLTSSCNSALTTFAYTGQRNENDLTLGTITYGTNPVLTIVAKNADDIITQNYYQDSEGSVDDFMKLTASEINITAPTTDASNTGVNSSLLPITSVMSTGTLSQTSDRGVLEYQFSDNDHFYYQRSSNAIVAPFLSDIDFNIANITSATDQNITATTLNDVTTTSGISIRFGRLFIENSFGPETANLTQPFKTQYWDGSQFVVNNDDNCSAFDSSKMSLTNISLDPALTGLSVDNGSVVSGSTNRLILQAPGEGNTGAVQVDYVSFDWLKYNWSGTASVTENPSAIATFGVFRGNDRIINWREVDN